MKRLLFTCIAALMALSTVAQDYNPTINWPYLYPDFVQGEITYFGGKTAKAPYNIHIGRGALHFVENGTIGEATSGTIMQMTLGDELFRTVEGKLLKVLADGEFGYVVEETLADYSAVVRNDGVYKKAFSAFLKENSIKWKNPQDLVKVVDYITVR